MKNVLKMTALVLCCVALVACSQKGPAEAALTAATTAVDGVKVEAAKYVPDQAKSLMASLTDARAAFDKGDYKAALEAATAIPAVIPTCPPRPDRSISKVSTPSRAA